MKSLVRSRKSEIYSHVKYEELRKSEIYSQVKYDEFKQTKRKKHVGK